MALKLKLELESGFSGDYWKITHISYDVMRETCKVKIALFKSEADRKSGAIAVSAKNITVQNMSVDKLANNILPYLYGEIQKSIIGTRGRESNIFTNAENLL